MSRKPSTSPRITPALAAAHGLTPEEYRRIRQLIGRTPYLQPVHVVAPGHTVGEVVRVRAKNVMAHSLGADLVSSFAPAAVAI